MIGSYTSITSTYRIRAFPVNYNKSWKYQLLIECHQLVVGITLYRASILGSGFKNMV